MQKDVILVTFNYRLGPLGFMHFDDPSLDVAGNAGLKDQLLVLKWVQENIEKFGGDRDNVTLVGDSAGAGSVSYHLLSDVSKNLFHRAILMSGSAFCFWSVMPPNHLSLDLAKATGWNGIGGEKEAYAYLVTVDPQVLTKASTTLLKQEHYEQGFVFSFGPMVETAASDSSFMLQHPIKLSRNAWSKDIDIIIGHTSNEGLMDARSNAFEMYKESDKYQLFIPRDARNGKSETTLLNDTRNIKAMYNDFKDVSQDNLQSFFEFISDSRFIHGIHRNILSRVNGSQSLGKTYSYRFSYDFPNRNHHKIVFGASAYKGACHADDISYLFTNGWGPVPEKDTDEWHAVQKMVDLFTGFAIKGSEKMRELGWTEVQKDDLLYKYKGMDINDEWKMQKMNELTRMNGWDALYQEGDLY